MGKYAIFIVSALIFSLLMYSSALRNALFMSNTRIVENHSINQAYNIAQSAMMIVAKDIVDNGEDSSFHPEEDSNYSYPSATGFQNWEEMHGSYNVVTANQGDTLLTIQATGRFEESRYIVSVGFLKTGGTVWMPPIDQAIHAEDTIDMSNGTVYGDVSTNGVESSLDLGNGTINGSYSFYDSDQPSGPVEEGGKKEGGKGEITNGKINMEEKIVYSDPVFPAFSPPPFEGQNFSGSYIHASDINESYFSNFSTSNTTIDLGVYDEVILHVNDIDLSGGLNIVGDGMLKIYVETGLNLGNGDINAGGSSKQLGLFFKGSNDIDFKGNGTFSGLLFAGNTETDITMSGNPTFNGHIISFGDLVEFKGNDNTSSLIYAPNALVDFKGTGNYDFRGSIISDTFAANGNVSVIYDEDLEDELPELEGQGEPTFLVSYWN